MKVRAHVLIKGIVQGVFFRANTKRKADELGVNGWVKNTSDGNVEAVFEGEKENVEKLIEWARKGPKGARVDTINVEWSNYKGEFENFRIKYF